MQRRLDEQFDVLLSLIIEVHNSTAPYLAVMVPRDLSKWNRFTSPSSWVRNKFHLRLICEKCKQFQSEKLAYEIVKLKPFVASTAPYLIKVLKIVAVAASVTATVATLGAGAPLAALAALMPTEFVDSRKWARFCFVHTTVSRCNVL
jgi:hypothetical protein